ncbi:arylesterase [Puniceicoccus vermicola]|uniref:arylesterase n=1 Tax=Puniceicoccus vermicola TaxID=388746 RepID=UPI001C8C845E
MIFTSTAGGESRIVFLGDSLTAGYGLDPEQAYPALLESRLSDEGIEATVVNAGVSGDTSAGGLRRVNWVLSQPTDVLLVALGGNDGLRGQPTEALAENLTAIIETARSKYPDIQILLAGMQMPASMGKQYQQNFAAVYPTVAEENGVTLIPFLLKDVAGAPALNQSDQIHPNAKGQEIIAETVWPYLQQAVRAE